MVRKSAYGELGTRFRWSSTAVALTLQLCVGIGATAAVGAMLFAYVAFPLPFPSARAIVQVQNIAPNPSPTIVTDQQFNEGWSRMSGPFQRVTGLFHGTGPIVPLAQIGDGERLSVCAVAGDFFGVLGVQPRVGRGFSDDELRTSAHVAVVTETVWRSRFGGRPDVLGSIIRTDRGPYAVVGVLEDRYAFPAEAEAWVPRIPYAGTGRFMALQVLARLRPGWTTARATQAVAALAPPVRPGQARPSVRLVRLADLVQENTRRPVTGGALLGMFVLAAVVINVSHLWMVQAMKQRRECAVRLALGASVASLRGMVYAKTLRACVPGTVLAAVVACWSARLAAVVAPRSYYYSTPLSTVFTAAVGFVLAIFPILVMVMTQAHIRVAIRPLCAGDLRPAIGASAGVREATGWVSWILMASQAGLAVALSVAALAFAKSFTNVESTDLGYQWRGLVTFRVALPSTSYQNAELRARGYERLLADLRTLWFVDDAEATAKPLLSNPGQSVELDQPQDEKADQRWVTPGFLRSIGARLLDGRHLERADGDRNVAVVNAAYVRNVLRGERALGRIVPFHPGREIVGVVDDIRETDVPIAQPPVAYLPLTGAISSTQIVLRVRAGAAADPGAIRRAAAKLDPAIALTGIQTMEQRIEEARAPWRAKAVVVSWASGTCLVVLFWGVLSVLWHTLEQQRQAIAIRLALGATPGHIATHLCKAFGFPMVAGTAFGLWGGWALLAATAKQLYGVAPGAGASYAVAAGAVLGPAFLLSLLVARRATRMDLRGALQNE